MKTKAITAKKAYELIGFFYENHLTEYKFSVNFKQKFLEIYVNSSIQTYLIKQ